ncbi:hypothetical protein AgCh_034430 [Apium graveolens]
MKPNSAKIITTFLGYKVVEFNLESDKAYLIRLDQDIRKARINDLRAAIFQIGEDTVELKNAKRLKLLSDLEDGKATRTEKAEQEKAASASKMVVEENIFPDIEEYNVEGDMKG